MTKELPRLTAKEVIAVLERVGFTFTRQSGSHKIFKNSEGKRVTVPFHDSKILHPKILKNILKDANIDIERLRELL